MRSMMRFARPDLRHGGKPGWSNLILAVMLGLLTSALILPAGAAPRDEAKRHFKGGMQLIANGEVDKGIAELELAYEILPHPNVMFNIGRAYMDAGRTEEALSYFRRYVDSGPPDAADVQALILNLEEEQALAAKAAGAKEIEMVEGEVSAEQMKALMELAERLEETATRMESRPLGGGRPSAFYGDAELSADELLAAKSVENIYEEEVVSASRQATSPLDAPVSTHIITAEDIRMSGAVSIPDLLRTVPGIDVMQMGPGNHNIGVRGFNQRMNNKVLVLVDGRSVYFDFLGPTYWKTLAVNLADIERIEIIRGPGSTLYGANAFSGVINIITKPAGDKNAEFGVIGGMGETVLGNVRYSDRIRTVGYGLSVGYEQQDRFELEYDPGRQDIATSVEDPTLGVRALRVNGGMNWLPRRDTQVGISAGMSHLYVDWYALGLLRNFYMNSTYPYVRADIRHKGITARAFWNGIRVPDAGPVYVAPGALDSLKTDISSDIIDVEAAYSGDAMIGVPHNISVGVGFRIKTIAGFHEGTKWNYIDDTHVERHLNGFIEDRITFLEDGEKFNGFATVLGFRFDQHPLVGFTPSPRFALVAKPTAGMAIRASAGTAFRIPTFMESYLELRVPGPVNGAELITYGNTGLEPELIRNIEIGYRYEGSDYFMFDVAGYYQRVSNLIALTDVTSTYDYGLDEEVNPDQLVAGTSQWDNMDQSFGGFGIEPAVHLFPIDGLDISVNYAFNYLVDLDLYKEDPDAARDSRSPMHKLNGGVQYRSPFFLDFGLNVNYVSAYTIPERTFDDLGDVVSDPQDMDAFFIINARIILRLLEDKLSVGVTGTNLTAFGKDGGHKEHAFGQTIGPRLYGSISYKF